MGVSSEQEGDGTEHQEMALYQVQKLKNFSFTLNFKGFPGDSVDQGFKRVLWIKLYTWDKIRVASFQTEPKMGQHEVPYGNRWGLMVWSQQIIYFTP